MASQDVMMSARKMVAHATGVAAIAVAAVVMPCAVEATDGDAVLVGTKATGSSTNAAIWSQNANGNGVAGETAGSESAGVLGSNTGAGWGVLGTTTSSVADRAGAEGWNYGIGPGVRGWSANGNGVQGEALDKYASGVVGWNKADGPGVTGFSEQGSGVVAKSETGIALEVGGRAFFANAGRATLPKGQSSRTVYCRRIGPNPAILVTLMGNPGVQVKYAVRVSDQLFKVVFTGPAVRSAPFAYFVVN